MFHTVVIKERDGETIALTDQHNPNESREAENLIKRHHKRLSEINSINHVFGTTQTMTDRKSGDWNIIKKRKELDIQTHEFLKSIKQREIERNNQLLLNKLVKISIGKKGLFKIPNFDRTSSISRQNMTSAEEMKIQDDGSKSENSPERQSKAFKSRRGTHDVIGGKRSLKCSP